MKYVIGIKHPDKGNLFLRCIQSTEAHVTSNINYVLDSASATSKVDALKLVDVAKHKWRNMRTKRNKILFNADKYIIKIEDKKPKQEKIPIVSLEEFSNGQD